MPALPVPAAAGLGKGSAGCTGNVRHSFSSRVSGAILAPAKSLQLDLRGDEYVVYFQNHLNGIDPFGASQHFLMFSLLGSEGAPATPPLKYLLLSLQSSQSSIKALSVLV